MIHRTGRLSTTVEIILYYLTLKGRRVKEGIYNSRNYSILLNLNFIDINGNIYNSRNYSILLNGRRADVQRTIYNSRNYSILLNNAIMATGEFDLQQ